MRNDRFGRFPQSRRVHHRSRWIVLLGTALAASGVTAAPAAAAERGNQPQNGKSGPSADEQDLRMLSFSIPAEPLEAAIAEFQRVTGLKVVLADPRIATLQSPGVSGSLTPGRAMEAMLRGTNVRATFTAD